MRLKARGELRRCCHTGIVAGGFSTGCGPRAALASYGYDACGRWHRAVVVSSAGDLAHGVVKGQAEDLDEEGDGIAGQVALGPAPPCP